MKKILSVLVCAVLTCFVLKGIGRVVEDKDALIDNLSFYEEAGEYDVLFLGTSHVHNAIAPVILWQEQGIPSYNLSSAGCRMGMAYWMLRCALNRTTPKVVVVDCAYIHYTSKVHGQSGNMHRAFDAIPLSADKIQAVFDLYEDLEHRVEMLWPFAFFHDRWNGLTERDFLPVKSLGKGHLLAFDVCPVTIPQVEGTKTEEPVGVGIPYLRKIAELCKERGIQLMLTFLPFEYDDESEQDMVWLHSFAEENGLRYLDGNELVSVIDERVDYKNGSKNNSHMNWSGAQKISTYIGKVLREQYDLPDRREDPAYRSWEEGMPAWREEKWVYFRMQEDFYSRLMLAADRDLDVVIEMNQRDWLEDGTCRALMENLGIEPEWIGEDTRLILIHGGSGYVDILDGNGGESCLGKAEIVQEKGKNYTVTLDGKAIYSGKEKSKGQVKITWLYGEEREIIDSAAYSYKMAAGEAGKIINATKE